MVDSLLSKKSSLEHIKLTKIGACCVNVIAAIQVLYHFINFVMVVYLPAVVTETN